MFLLGFGSIASALEGGRATEGFRVKQVFIEGHFISSEVAVSSTRHWLARTVSAPAAKNLGAVHRPLADGDGASAGLSQADNTTSWVPCRFSWRAFRAVRTPLFSVSGCRTHGRRRQHTPGPQYSSRMPSARGAVAASPWETALDRLRNDMKRRARERDIDRARRVF